MREGKRQKDPHAVALGRKGGQASRKYLDPETKRQLAQKAAKARWGKRRGTQADEAQRP